MKSWVIFLSILVFLLVSVVIVGVWFYTNDRAYFEYKIRENNSLIFRMGESISPHGFGFYPTIPDPLPKHWEREDIFSADDVFPTATEEQELMLRVEIKLLAEGKNVLDVRYSSGYLVAIYPDTIYVRYNQDGSVNTGGTQEITNLIDGIANDKGVVFPDAADIPSHIKVVSFEDGVIDPYKFLNLPNRNQRKVNR